MKPIIDESSSSDDSDDFDDDYEIEGGFQGLNKKELKDAKKEQIKFDQQHSRQQHGVSDGRTAGVKQQRTQIEDIKREIIPDHIALPSNPYDVLGNDGVIDLTDDDHEVLNNSTMR